jgi:hypothetical protein
VYGHSRAPPTRWSRISAASASTAWRRRSTAFRSFNGSPERTNSPVVMLGPAAVESGRRSSKALPSVTRGSGDVGRTPRVEHGVPAGDSRRGPVSASVNTTYSGARDGLTTRGSFAARAGSWEAGATFLPQ